MSEWGMLYYKENLNWTELDRTKSSTGPHQIYRKNTSRSGTNAKAPEMITIRFAGWISGRIVNL